MDASIEHVNQSLGNYRPHPGIALGENIGSQADQSACFGFVERIADTTGMGANNVELELTKVIRRDSHIGQLADAGIDSVNRIVLLEDRFDDPARLRHLLERFIAQSNLFAIPCDGRHRFERQRLTIKSDHEFDLPET